MNRDSLRERIIFLRDSSSAPPNIQLTELLHLESITKTCILKYDSVYTLLLQRIGAVYYKVHDLYLSEKFIKSAIQIIEDNSGKPIANPKQLVRDYYILSLIYDSLGRTSKKITAQDSCISISIRTGQSDIFVLYTIENRVAYYYDAGDYHRCINFAKEGELLTPKIIHSKDSLIHLQDFTMWRVNSYIFINDFDEAEKILINKLMDPESSGPGNFLGAVYERLADVEIYHTNYSKALYYYNKSLDFSKKNADYFRYMQTLVNMGFNLYSKSTKDKRKALTCYHKALQYASLAKKNATTTDSLQIKVQELNIYSNIANVYTKSGLYDSAQFYFHRAFIQINQGLNENNLLDSLDQILIQNNAAIYLFSTLLDQGDAYLDQYVSTKNKISLFKASQIYITADKLETRIKSVQTDEQSLLFWRNHLRRLYENSIQAYYLLKNTDAALYFFEKSRAILLNDQLRKQHILENGDMYELSRVKKKILKITMEFNGLDPSSYQYKALQNEIFIKRQELNILEQSIKNKNPLFYQSLPDTIRITLKDIQNTILKDHTAVLEIFNGDSAVYTLIVTSDRCFLRKIEKKEFDKLADLYTTYITNAILLNKHYPQFLQVASQLFDLLFQDIPLLKGRIVISPDGKYFPFEALITNKNFKSPEYFLSDHIVSYTYSARFLLNDYVKNSAYSTGDFLGIAPVQYPRDFNLASLPQSDVSLEKINGFFRNTKTLVASRASKNNFMQQFYGYKIIQLYTHASDSSGNGEPVIFFADSVISLSELIPEKKTATQLIVLSACETGNGKFYKGEGVFSFNRGFAALGIPSSIINLWSVENESTYKITELFYKFAADGLPLDVALQKAKLEFIATSSKEKRLPYYWAAAILAGKADAIEFNEGFTWRGLAIDIGIIFICLAFIMFRRKNK